MNRYKIEGGARLCGSIDVHGAKNAALPILAATVINGGKSVIHNCPDLSDIRNTIEILEILGCRVDRHKKDVIVDSSTLSLCDIPGCVMSKTRSSSVFAGALAARCKRALIAASGGCQIGARPIDIHLDAFKALGMDIIENDEYVTLNAENMKAGKVVLRFPSVGATENVMLASSLTEGPTTIYNAAHEPEIINLADYLRSIGVDISGDGSSVIKIRGTLSPCDGKITVMPDRIVAATYISAALASGGDVYITGADCRHISSVIALYRKMGADISIKNAVIHVRGDCPLFNLPYIRTAPYPGFPTDCQPFMTTLMSVSAGTGILKETVFENRFGHCQRLRAFGADIDIRDSLVIIKGVNSLRAADVAACDLRCGAALCIAALASDGISTISYTEYIDRGYEDLCASFKSLGAQIERIE